MIRTYQDFGMTARVAVLLAAVFVLRATSTATSATVSGKVTKVTLYRGQAMVAREVVLEGPGGTQEIIVGGLPEYIVSDTLFAEGSAGVEVRAVRYRTHAIGEAPRDEVREFDRQIEAVNEKTAVNCSAACTPLRGDTEVPFEHWVSLKGKSRRRSYVIVFLEFRPGRIRD